MKKMTTSYFLRSTTISNRFKSNIQDAKYERVDPELVAEKQAHLTTQQRKDLADVLGKYDKLFDGTLGRYPHRKVHLDIAENAIPKHQRPYSVARTHETVF